FRILRTSLGEPAAVGIAPQFSSCCSNVFLSVSLSSTMSILLPFNNGLDEIWLTEGEPLTLSLILNLNEDPLSIELSALISPPMSLISFSHITRPSPVPPYLRVVDESI